MLSFIGVSGFDLMRYLAVSRHAPSLSLFANAAALSSSFFTILLYSVTNPDFIIPPPLNFLVHFTKVYLFHFISNQCK